VSRVSSQGARRTRLALGLAGIALLAVAAVGAYLTRHRAPDQSERAGTAVGAPFARNVTPRPLPDIRFEDQAGRDMSLADFRGKVVLLNIWATWCAPCRKEMPTLDRLQAKLGGPDFEVLALSIDAKGAPAVREFFRAIGAHALKLYVDPSMQAADALRVPGIPTTLLIDRAGRRIGQHVGPVEWDSTRNVNFLRELIAAQGRAPAREARDGRADRAWVR